MAKKDLEVLNEFMNMSIYSTDEIFNKFSTDNGGAMFEVDGHKFYFKPGNREDRILIVAHADTVWDTRYNSFLDKMKKDKMLPPKKKYMVQTEGEYYSQSELFGIGADDRAGAAMAWLLKDSGNSILITDEEEIGAQTSQAIMRNEDWYDVINSHKYILQLDLNGSKEFKCYSAGSESFKTYIENETGYRMRPNFSYTDVKFLGKKICGANLSIGYYNEHGNSEFLDKFEWSQALKIAHKLSNQKHQQYYIEEDFGEKTSYDKLLNKLKLQVDKVNASDEVIDNKENLNGNEMQ